MVCFEAQGLITKYLNNELNDDKLRAFLEHIESCDECREELEIYFTVTTGFRQLDRDEELTDNFNVAFKKNLADSKNRLVKRTKKRRRNVIYLVILIGVLTPLMMGIESSQVSDKNEVVYTDVEESVYELDYYYKYDLKKLDEFIECNKKDIIEFVDGIEENDAQSSVD